MPYMPNEPNATRKPPLKLPSITRRTSRNPIPYLFPNSPLQSPDYRRRLEKLPEYKESLHARYPPVCDSCLPAIEEEIQNRDHMARTKALGGWLKESKGKDHSRHVSGSTRDRDHLTFEILAWRARGILWMFSLVLALLGYSAGAQRELVFPSND